MDSTTVRDQRKVVRKYGWDTDQEDNFGRRTHLFASIDSFVTETKNYRIQPYDGLGAKDGKALEEENSNIQEEQKEAEGCFEAVAELWRLELGQKLSRQVFP